MIGTGAESACIQIGALGTRGRNGTLSVPFVVIAGPMRILDTTNNKYAPVAGAVSYKGRRFDAAKWPFSSMSSKQMEKMRAAPQ